MTATAQKYGTILTAAGKRAIANAVATDTPVDITYVAIGDGGGNEYYPGENQEDLKNQIYQIHASQVYVDPANDHYIVVEAYIPEDVGGWVIREACIKTEDETVIAIGNYPSTYKPVLAEGSSTGLNIKFILEVTNASNVTIKVDPSLIFVTKQYVDNSIANHNSQTNVHGGTYERRPNRLMLRNDDARCQVSHPVDDFDAVTKKYMEDWIAAYIDEYISQNIPDESELLTALVRPGAFYDFLEESPPPGWMVRNGALITSADIVVPNLWNALQSSSNAWKLLSESEWQAQSQSAPWNGVGGVPKFVLDLASNTIRLPDTRGMYKEDAGFDGLAVGGVHGDAIRNILGGVRGCVEEMGSSASGAFALDRIGTPGPDAGNFSWGFTFDPSRVVPTASVNRPRAFGVLGCVYVGPSA